jgi:hypothetical protein
MTVTEPSLIERAWAAGFFDGEGCWHVKKEKKGFCYLVLQIGNSELVPLPWS